MSDFIYALQVGELKLNLHSHLIGGLVPLTLYIFVWLLSKSGTSKRGPLIFNKLGAVALTCSGLLPAFLLTAMMASQSSAMTTIGDLSGVFALKGLYEKACRYDRNQMSAAEVALANQDLHRSDIFWIKQGTAIDRPLQKDQPVDCSMMPRLASLKEDGNLRKAFIELYYLCLGASVILGWGLIISVLILVLRGSLKVQSPVETVGSPS